MNEVRDLSVLFVEFSNSNDFDKFGILELFNNIYLLQLVIYLFTFCIVSSYLL